MQPVRRSDKCIPGNRQIEAVIKRDLLSGPDFTSGNSQILSPSNLASQFWLTTVIDESRRVAFHISIEVQPLFSAKMYSLFCSASPQRLGGADFVAYVLDHGARPRQWRFGQIPPIHESGSS